MSKRRALEGYLTEEEQADRLGISVRTLRRWRRRGTGPRPTRIGRFNFYSPAAEKDYLARAEQPIDQPCSHDQGCAA